MLRFHVQSIDLSGPWRADGSGWRAGRSYIEPYPHPALEHFSITAAERVLIVVRERLAGVSRAASPQSHDGVEVVGEEAFLDEYGAALQWPLDYVAVQLSLRADAPAVELRAGMWGSAPLYLVSRGGDLWGDWDPAELYAHLTSEQLSAEYAARFLVNCDQPYSRRTLIPEIQRLTERARALWTPEGGSSRLAFEYPPDAPLQSARKLKPGADPVAGFLEIVGASARRWLTVPPESLSAQLSGGLDSAIVAGVVAGSSPEPLRTFGLLMPGDLGAQQQRRRAELARLFGLKDEHLNVGDYEMFSQDGSRVPEGRVVPWEEIFIEGFEALLSLTRGAGCVVSFNGTGGDELCSLHWPEMTGDEQARRRQQHTGEPAGIPPFLTRQAREAFGDTRREDWAPVSPLFTSALEAAAAVSGMFLRHGVWPVSPLCTPELVAFCQRLPLEWRENRRIEREVLLRLGCSREVVYPTSPEHFGPFVEQSVRAKSRPLFAQLFSESRLGELGLVDAERLRFTYDEHCEGRGGYDSIHFYAAAVLELTLRCVAARRGRV
ncbi:MAG TPA: asparagine synthase C-terminal domain-containing protein [Pyrinomonadaceae bacterium]|jgi:asparagine synthase (glutamine-hydrolysing)